MLFLSFSASSSEAKASTSLPSVPKASTMPVLPPASAAMKAKAAAKSQEAAAPKAEEAGEVTSRVHTQRWGARGRTIGCSHT